VLALRRLRDEGKSEVKALHASIYANVPENVMLLAATMLNESSETVVNTSVIDRLFFLSHLLKLKSVPKNCFTKQTPPKVNQTAVLKWLESCGYKSTRKTRDVLRHVMWAGEEFVNYLMQRAAIDEDLHALYSDSVMRKFEDKGHAFAPILRKAFVERVINLARFKKSGTSEQFPKVEVIVGEMCDRTQKAWKEIETFGTIVGELLGTNRPLTMNEFSQEEQEFGMQLLHGSDLTCDVLLKSQSSPTGQFGKFSVFFEKRRAAVFVAERAGSRHQEIVAEQAAGSSHQEIESGSEDWENDDAHWENDDAQDDGAPPDLPSTGVTPAAIDSTGDEGFSGEHPSPGTLTSSDSFQPPLGTPEQPQSFVQGEGEYISSPESPLAHGALDDFLPAGSGDSPSSEECALRQQEYALRTRAAPESLYEEMLSPAGLSKSKKRRPVRPQKQPRPSKSQRLITEAAVTDAAAVSAAAALGESIKEMRDVVAFLGGSFPEPFDPNRFGDEAAQLVIVQAHGMDAANLVSCLNSASDALGEDGTCVVLCQSQEYEQARALIKGQSRLHAEAEPL
jgi:hypothetical protein